MNKMEILAPAGGPESVLPAVRCGADAIYLGAWSLSARASAQNFDREQLRQAVEYCHARGVKVYLACNILMFDNELKRAMEIIEYACSIPVDALIMQDVGLVSLVREAAPDMRIHASTQMSVHTPKGVELLSKMGFKRVVLSRELSRDEIYEIAKNSPIELEVFVHGALCMSVSGQCYFSAMLGSRSGNRGACAQPCRLPFSVNGGTGHDLSLKDCSVISHLRELQDMGITSAKIEGRMKRPEYTAVSVAACRQSLDTGRVDPDLSEKLGAVFSRSGFTDGYFTGKRGIDMFGIRSKDDVTSATSKIYSSIHSMYKDERQSIPIDAVLGIHSGKPAELTVSDNENRSVTVSGAVPEKALKVALNEEKCRSYIQKTGGTPFCLNSFKADIDNDMSMPALALNSMRRDALEKLMQMRTQRDAVVFDSITYPETSTRKKTVPKYFRARFTGSYVPDEFLDSELIYVPIDLKDSEYNSLLDRGFAVAVEIPRGMFGIERKIYDRLLHIRSLGINEVLASNLGAVELAKELDMDIHGGFGLNITNTKSVEWAEKNGLLDIELSFELKLEQIAMIGGRIPIGIITGGRLPLMLTRNCPADNSKSGEMVLRDRKGMEFPMHRYGACTEILNSVPLKMSDRKRELVGIDFEVLRFSVENSVEIGENLRVFNSEKGGNTAFTRGLYYRGVE